MVYRVGVVGCGAVAKAHAKSLAKLDNVTVVGFADIRPERSAEFAAEYGGNAYASLNELLEKEELDVLHICTPHALHVPMALKAAEKGINVFTEKPAAVNEEQMDALLEAAKKVKVGVCFQNHYNDNSRYVEQELKSGRAGKILGARAFVTWKRLAPYYTESGWRGTRELECGGVLINQAIHTLDLLRSFIGDPKAVEAKTSNHHLKSVIEVEDTVEAYIQFEDCAASFYATTAYCQDAPIMLELICENKSYRIEGADLYIKEKDAPRFTAINFAEKEAFGKGYWGTGHLACIRNYYASLSGEEEYLVTLPEVDKTMRLMFAIYRSAEENRPIELC
ncbi:MAG: Gfo/Idh/MocA family oxidoreductase [Lachnospiraceae bacterium]|nr:Gfo/Idh/MocA family oxidoreductase [Lachnospiraceae bacterium]